MTVREGSLEAPTRHPVEWRLPDFYEEEKLFAELERIFGICHGCRRCVNLCTAFPTLFDLVDASATLEVDGVEKSQFWKVVNPVNRNAAARSLMEKAIGVHPERKLPPYSPGTFRGHAAASRSHEVRNGERAPGRVAVFSTCYVNYNEPGIGHDLIAVLDHNEIPYLLVEKEGCCGMPKLELGDLEGVKRLKAVNVPRLAGFAREGYAILTPVPSCTLMFKNELPLLFPDDAEVKEVSEAMFDPFEYFLLRKRDGLLKTDFKTALGKVSYHVPCHSRVQNMGQKTRETLQLIPGTTLNTVERCSGHDGT